MGVHPPFLDSIKWASLLCHGLPPWWQEPWFHTNILSPGVNFLSGILLHHPHQQQLWLRWISSVDCLWRRRVILRHTRHVLSCPCAIWGSISLLMGTVTGDRRRPFRRAYPWQKECAHMYTHVYTLVHMCVQDRMNYYLGCVLSQASSTLIFFF